jgi:iron complex transport system substrate-binding protein
MFFIVVAAIAGGVPAADASVFETTNPAAEMDNGVDVGCSFPVTVTDATDERISVEERPDRIVALQPSVAQTLWEIGARERVVGMPVNEYTAYLDGSRNRTNVVQADDYSTDVETVVSLEPDIVLAPNVVSNETVGRLRELGLTVYRFRYGRSLGDIYRKTNRTGRLVGECGNATVVVEAMQTRVERIRSAVAGRDRPRVLYLAGQYTAGNGTFVHDAIEFAGGRNIAAAAGIEGYQTISDEVVVERNPEWIVTTGSLDRLESNSAYSNTSAIRNNQTVVLDSNLLSQPAPRVIVPITHLATQLHPGASAQLSKSLPQSTLVERKMESGHRSHKMGRTNSSRPRKTRDSSTPAVAIGFQTATILALLSIAFLRRLR